jgi:hypothetical protein
MKDKVKILYVIEKSPEFISAKELINKIEKNAVRNNPIAIYIQGDGIRWLLNEHWQNIINRNEHIVFYANAKDAKEYNTPFREDVIFSNPKILYQLLNWADQVFFIH